MSVEHRLLVDLRIVDLKNELDRRNLDVSGLKVDLIERLRKAMEAEGKDPQSFEFSVQSDLKKSGDEEMSDDIENDVEDLPIEEELSILSDEGNEKDTWDGADEGKMGGEATGKEEIPGPDDVEPRHLFTTEDTIQLHMAAHSHADSASVIAQRGDESSTMSDPGESVHNAPSANGDLQSLGEMMAETTAAAAEEQTRLNTQADGKQPATEKSDNNCGAVGAKRFVRSASDGDGTDAVNNKSKDTGPPASKGAAASSGKNLWISGLSSTTRAADLKAAFTKYGRVLVAKIVTSAKQPGSKCYGFVSMGSMEEASKCIQNLHRTELHSKMISVERSKNDNVIPSKKPVDGAASEKAKESQAKADSADKADAKVAGVKSDSAATAEREGNAELSSKEDSGKAEKNGEKKDERKRSRSKSHSRERSSRRRSRERESSHHRSSSRTERPRITAPTRGASGFYRGHRPYYGSRTAYSTRPVPGNYVARRYERPGEEEFERRPTTGYRGRGAYGPAAPYGGREDPQLLRIVEERERERIAYERVRQRDIELAQKEEKIRLDRERERIRFERERLEREKMEVEHLKQIQLQSLSRSKRIMETSSYPDPKRPAYVGGSSSYSRDRPVTSMPPRYPEGPQRESFNRDLDGRRGPPGPPTAADRYGSRVATVDRGVRLPESPRGAAERPRLPPPARDDRRREDDRRSGRSPPSTRDHRRPPSPPRVPARRDFPPLPASLPTSRGSWQDDRDRRHPPVREERGDGGYPSTRTAAPFVPGGRGGGVSGSWTGAAPPRWTAPSRDTTSWQPRGGGSSSRGDSGYGSYPTSDRYASSSTRRY